jgi:FimV-like protein
VKRTTLIALLVSGLAAYDHGAISGSTQSVKTDGAREQKRSPAAENTKSKLLTVKVGGTFMDIRLGDILKEIATLVEMKAGEPVMWTYGPGFPAEKRVSFTSKDETLEAALDKLLKQAGNGAGYVIVSSPGDKHDGWVRLTANGERGTEQASPSSEDEGTAVERLALARKLIEAGKLESAKPLLEAVIRKSSTTNAAREARKLLEKIEK